MLFYAKFVFFFFCFLFNDAVISEAYKVFRCKTFTRISCPKSMDAKHFLQHQDRLHYLESTFLLPGNINHTVCINNWAKLYIESDGMAVAKSRCLQCLKPNNLQSLSSTVVTTVRETFLFDLLTLKKKTAVSFETSEIIRLTHFRVKKRLESSQTPLW